MSHMTSAITEQKAASRAELAMPGARQLALTTKSTLSSLATMTRLCEARSQFLLTPTASTHSEGSKCPRQSSQPHGSITRQCAMESILILDSAPSWFPTASHSRCTIAMVSSIQQEDQKLSLVDLGLRVSRQCSASIFRILALDTGTGTMS